MRCIFYHYKLNHVRHVFFMWFKISGLERLVVLGAALRHHQHTFLLSPKWVHSHTTNFFFFPSCVFLQLFVHKAFTFQDAVLIPLNCQRPRDSEAFMLLSVNVQQKQQEKTKAQVHLGAINPKPSSLKHTETIHYSLPFSTLFPCGPPVTSSFYMLVHFIYHCWRWDTERWLNQGWRKAAKPRGGEKQPVKTGVIQLLQRVFILMCSLKNC